MQVEALCTALLEHFLPIIDAPRKGYCIDIGAGDFALYCELFASMRYKTIVVEPLPTPVLHELVAKYDMTFFESCISNVDGSQTIYIGTYDSEENVNLSSLIPNWWGVSSESKQVASMTLKTLLSKVELTQITCLKLDVEGLESQIISQLQDIHHLPKILMFEYGGGGVRSEQQGAWDVASVSEVVKSLNLLRNLGYIQGIVIDSAENTREQIINLQEDDIHPDMLFYPHARYGNIILFHGLTTGLEQVAQIAKPYLATKQSNLGIWQRLLQNFRKRIIRYHD